MRTSTRSLLLVPLAAIAAAVMLQAQPANATPSTPSHPSSSSAGSPHSSATGTTQNLSFGIGPALPVPSTQVVDGRPYLNYLASPGATIRDAVALLNYGTKPVTLDVYASDGFDTDDGSFALTAAGAKLKDAGTWFKLGVPKSGKVTVPARHGNTYGRVEVPIEARIPANADPGDHVAGIVASLETLGKDKEGARIRFDQRLGLRAYVRLSGAMTAKLSITHLHASHHTGFNLMGLLGRGTTTVTYDVKNTGNVRMNATQIVNLSGWFTHAHISYPPDVKDLLPGSTVHITEEAKKRWAFGKQSGLVSAIPQPLDPTVPRPAGLTQAHVSFWTIPWFLLLIILVLLLLGIGFWRWRRHRRARLRRLADDGAPTDRRRRRSKESKRDSKREPAARLAATLAVLIACGLVTAPAHADDTSVNGGKIMLEANAITGEPANALSDGVWGHEGPNHDQATFVGADFSDSDGQPSAASQALWLQRFDVTDFNDIGIAFVNASKDGSSETPAVHAGENAGEAFPWFTTASLGSGLLGSTNPYGDAVLVVHTLAQYEDWVRAGKPDQVFDGRLVAHDASAPGTPVSAHPQGRSIQNAWPTGADVSLVAFKYDGFTPDGIPLMAADKTGHAITAWLTFRTVAGASDPTLRTSAGYHVLSASPLPIAPDKVKNPGATTTGAASITRRGSATASSTGSASPHGSSTATADGSSSPAAHATAAPAGNGTADAAASNRHTGGSATRWGLGIGLLAIVLIAAAVLARRRRTP